MIVAGFVLLLFVLALMGVLAVDMAVDDYEMD